MRNLINFIIKYTYQLLFLLLVSVSIFLLVHGNGFQHSKYLSFIREINGRFFAVSDYVTSFVHLKSDNQDLLERIAKLETEISDYRIWIENMQDVVGNLAIPIDSTATLRYTYIPARVVNNRVSGIENYITLNKGSKDGVEVDMGVLTPQGNIVGVVKAVSTHYSKIIPLLNSKYNPSGKVKRTDYFGPLVWDGGDYRYINLEELPRHVSFGVGDTIVTSGHSAIFPEGLGVGIIAGSKKKENDNFNTLRIRLFTDFATLSHVLIVQNNQKEERIQLEKDTSRNGN